MSSIIYKCFQELSSQDRQDGRYCVKSIGLNSACKLGCSIEGYPVFFIESLDDIKTSDIKLEMFHVMFNRKCNVSNVDTGIDDTKKYNVFQLNTLNPDLQKYFFDVMEILLSRLKGSPQTNVLKEEIIKIIQLFTKSQKLSLEVIRGLWAELLVIDQSADPEYLIRSWHVTPNEKYDFNDGQVKLEVKSTSGYCRKHLFSIDQLSPDGELLIASVFVNQIGIGKSIFDLVDKISGRVYNNEIILLLREIVWTTIGPHIDEVAKLYFDYNSAVENYALFNYRDIPSISKSCVPMGVDSVTFQSDLTGCQSIDKGSLADYSTGLFSVI